MPERRAIAASTVTVAGILVAVIRTVHGMKPESLPAWTPEALLGFGYFLAIVLFVLAGLLAWPYLLSAKNFLKRRFFTRTPRFTQQIGPFEVSLDRSHAKIKREGAGDLVISLVNLDVKVLIEECPNLAITVPEGFQLANDHSQILRGGKHHRLRWKYRGSGDAVRAYQVQITSPVQLGDRIQFGVSGAEPLPGLPRVAILEDAPKSADPSYWALEDSGPASEAPPSTERKQVAPDHQRHADSHDDT